MLSNVISSQAELHERFGGVVPEVASRHHLELVNAVVDEALERRRRDLGEVDSIAVTRRPGLIGALLVGVSTAKALAAATRKPLVGVDHLHGHVAANFLEPDPLEPPFLCLIASGGHTLLAAVRSHDGYEVLGQTLDDAAGEALDKAARLLGLGFPGGPAIERLAAEGDPRAFDMPGRDDARPRARLQLQRAEDGARLRGRRPRRRPSSSAAAPTSRRRFRPRSSGSSPPSSSVRSTAESWEAVALGGGVAANGPLRERTAEICAGRGVALKLVAPELCTDNAAMIASAARFVEARAVPRLPRLGRGGQ